MRPNRPERKNPQTFESCGALRDTFRALAPAEDADVVVLASNGGSFCSGGDVHDIIGPLVGMGMKGLLAFAWLTGDGRQPGACGPRFTRLKGLKPGPPDHRSNGTRMNTDA